jgi:hypothetical protein
MSQKGILVSVAENQQGKLPKIVTPLNRFPVQDIYSSIAFGQIPGFTAVHKFGGSPDIDAHPTGVPDRWVDLWDGGSEQPIWVPPAIEQKHLIVGGPDDTAGGLGAREIQIFGLGAGEHLSEFITMDGETAVFTVNLYDIIFRAFVTKAGPAGKNIDAITLFRQLEPGGIGARILAGNGQTGMCVFGLANNELGYLQYVRAAIKGINDVGGSIDVRLVAITADRIVRVKEELGTATSFGATPAERTYTMPNFIGGAGTYLKLQGKTNQNNMAMDGAFDLIVETVE